MHNISIEERLEQLTLAIEKLVSVPPIPAIPAVPAIPAIPPIIPDRSDHDLLLRIDTKMERVIHDVAQLNDNYSGRIDALEKSKLDDGAYEKGHIDHESRLRAVETFQNNLLGKLSILSAGISLLVAGIVNWVVRKFGV